MSEVYIRNQDKRRLFVLNNAHGIVCSREQDNFMKLSSGVKREEKQKEKYCIYLQGNGCQHELGTYGSLGRCIEVLDEIEQKCGQYLYAAGSLGLMIGSEAMPPMAAVIPRVYQMPEK